MRQRTSIRLRLFLRVLALCFCIAVLGSGFVSADTSDSNTHRSSSLDAASADAVAPLATDSTASSPSSSFHLLLLAIPLPGHVNPLLSIAFELFTRHYANTSLEQYSSFHMTLLSASTVIEHAHRQLTSLLELHSLALQERSASGEEIEAFASAFRSSFHVFDIGNCILSSEFDEIVSRSSQGENYVESLQQLHSWCINMTPCMYNGTMHLLRTNRFLKSTPPTMILNDLGSAFYGTDVADSLHLPMVINHPDIIDMVSPAVIPGYDFAPTLSLGYQQSYYLSPETFFGLPMRLLLPPIRFLVYLEYTYLHSPRWNSLREQFALPPKDLWTYTAPFVVLVDAAWGLEHVRPTPPNVHFIGSALPSLLPSPSTLSTKLNDPLVDFFVSTFPANLTVVFVSFGTLAKLTPTLFQHMFSALYRSSEARFLVVWKVDKQIFELTKGDALSWADRRPCAECGTNAAIYGNVMIIQWVRSQWALLASPRTSVFVSHCGINSAYESLLFSTPVLCIPFFADQPDMAVRVMDAGAGGMLERRELTDGSGKLAYKVEEIMRDGKYKKQAHRVADAIRLAGGARRASEIIEYIQVHGSKDFFAPHYRIPFYAAQGYDVICAYVLIGVLWMWITMKCMKGVCGRLLCCLSRKTRNLKGSKKEN